MARKSPPGKTKITTPKPTQKPLIDLWVPSQTLSAAEHIYSPAEKSVQPVKSGIEAHLLDLTEIRDDLCGLLSRVHEMQEKIYGTNDSKQQKATVSAISLTGQLEELVSEINGILQELSESTAKVEQFI